MKIIRDFLTVNPYSRWGRARMGTIAVVIHWTQVPDQPAKDVRDYFEMRKDGKHDGYGSAHYIIDLDGTIINCVPEEESAFHCGSSKIDPASGKTYTDIARKKFGVFAEDYIHKSPNAVTIGIEHCVIDTTGTMTSETYEASIELVADICKRYQLNPQADILLHHEIVGWKACHKWFVFNPKEWVLYKEKVMQKNGGIRG